MKSEFQLFDCINKPILVVNNELKIVFVNVCAKENYIREDSNNSLLNLALPDDHRFLQKTFAEYSTHNTKNQSLNLVLFDKHKQLQNVSLDITSQSSENQARFIVTIDFNHYLNDENNDNNKAELKFLKAIFDNTKDAIFLAPISPEGVHGNFIRVNQEACRRLGYSEVELMQLNARSINPDANLEKIRSFGRTMKHEGYAEFEAIHRAKNGENIPVDVHASMIEIEDRNYVLSVVKDLRKIKKSQKTAELFGRLMDHSWNEIYVFESTDLSIVQANKGARDNLGITLKEAHNSRFSQFLKNTSVEDFLEFSAELFSGEKSQIVYETIFQRKDGSTYPAEVRLQLSQGEVPPVFLAIVQDITIRKKTEENLIVLANYDVLTGLPNRTLFMDRLNMSMKTASRSDTIVALMFIDLDGFKSINDNFGHEAGDELLKEVGQRLLESVRESDTVARLGGDEFTIILTNLKQVDAVENIVYKIQSAINQPIELNVGSCHVTSSIGIALFPLSDVNDPFELIRQADMAMYQAKNAGKNTYKYFSDSISQMEARNIELSNELRTALELEEFEPYFQPRFDLVNDQLVSAEVLLRWTNPKLGFVSPVEFIPILEKTGLINEVGMWVIHKSFEYIRDWSQRGLNIRLSINVSAKQFEDYQFVNDFQKALTKYAVDPSLVEIEITEGLLISQSAMTIEMLKELKEMGIHISLDDFGTGYSSLSYLKQFPIDVLKIDRSFVMDMSTNPDSLAIVKAIISLAKSLNRRVTAEGIESKDHINTLKALGCDEGQGFFLGKPMPITEFAPLIECS